MGESTRLELEKIWKQRWEAAQVKLELAITHVKDIEQQIKAGSIPRSDAYNQALEAENSAFAEHSRVLQVYIDLMVHGKIPEEPGNSKANDAAGGNG